ncbi:hypothetical protein AKJ09_09135 [Labilithrix luteola]|uniref:Uncharacterized protein n=1 Tax=Labilithrix luteola TaxID=1391654 RepID=A0A0K1Q9X5_9BACT|nr:hypothetical protein AKJ09_09135 [Labilithrix luteola]
MSLACSSFGETDSADPSSTRDIDASGQVPTSDAATEPHADGGPTEELPELRKLCPPARGPSKGFADSKKTLLYEPPSRPRFPFAITTDAKYVYWIEQDNTADGYNGNSNARILRVSKAGGVAVEIASNQPSASALALDGEYVYWATYTAGSATPSATIARAGRVCAAGSCVVEPLTTLAAGGRVSKLVSAGPGVLVARMASANAALIDTKQATAKLSSLAQAASGVAPAPLAIYATRSDSAAIVEYSRDLGSSAPFTPTTSNDGYLSLASDCTKLWVTRSSSLLAVDIALRTISSAFPQTFSDVFDSAVDEKFFYVARANAGGVDAFEKITGAKTNLWSGNVFALDVDDDGIYWGDHAQSTGGDLYMLEK